MDDIRASEPYRDLVGRAGLDPALQQMAEFRIDDIGDNRTVVVRSEQRLDVDGLGEVRYCRTGWGDPDWSCPVGTNLVRRWAEPLHTPEIGSVPADQLECHLRLARLRDRLIHEINGSLEFTADIEVGWLPIVEALTAALVAVSGPEDRTAILVGSSSDGLAVNCEVGRADPAKGQYCLDLAAWAEAASRTRCRGCGRPHPANTLQLGAACGSPSDSAFVEPIAIQVLPPSKRLTIQRVSIAAPDGPVTQRLVAVAGRIFEIALATEAEVNGLPANLHGFPTPAGGRVEQWRAIRLRDLEAGVTTMHLVGRHRDVDPWLSRAVSVFSETMVVRAGGACFGLGEEAVGTCDEFLDLASAALINAVKDGGPIRSEGGAR